MSVTINGSSGLVFADNTAQTTAATCGLVNKIINGRMEIDQRNAGASVSFDGSSGYCLDRYVAQETTSSGSFTVQQSSTAPTGFINSLLLTVTAANSSLASSDRNTIKQAIEGLNVADLGWGTANAQTVTLSFWVRSSVTGTFGGGFTNSAGDRGYPFTYTISSANTWEQKSVTIAGDTSGTWLKTNGIGINVWFAIGCGTDYTGTAGAWASSGYRSATGATNLMATNGATFYITGVDLRKGSVGATSQTMDVRPYGTELALCQRYFYADRAPATGIGLCAGVCFTSSGPLYVYRYPVIMRTSPTFTYSALSDFHVVYSGAVSTPTLLAASAGSVSSCRLDATSTVVSGQGSILQTATGNAVLNFSAEL